MKLVFLIFVWLLFGSGYAGDDAGSRLYDKHNSNAEAFLDSTDDVQNAAHYQVRDSIPGPSVRIINNDKKKTDVGGNFFSLKKSGFSIKNHTFNKMLSAERFSSQNDFFIIMLRHLIV